MSVVGEGNFIEKAGTENVILDYAQVVKVIDSRGGNRPVGGKRRATKFIDRLLPVNIGNKADPVLRAEIVVDATVVGILRVALRVGKKETTYWVW